MTQIHSTPDEFSAEHIQLQIDDPELNLSMARDLAKKKARERNKNAMLLSWYCKKTGEYAPKSKCEYKHKPSWIVFAESRGANLTIDINNGEYIFIYLKL